ncbi:MAG: oxidoreductase [Rhodobacterales bacterium]|nr:MAG: oxidoreductase [Rhodobacterales bacterium]
MTQAVTTLKDGIAVVTGAGSGLGRALAMELAANGLSVVGFSRREAALQETADLIGQGRFTPMVVDVADGAAVRAAFEKIAQLGEVTILINNAAVFPHRDCLEETSESFMHTVAINLGGTFACSRSALQSMTKTGIGHIVNVSSFADIAPMPTAAAYSVSKGAGQILTRALVADLGDRFPGIVVNTWMPGMLATEMGPAQGLPPEQAARWGVRLALWQDAALNGVVFEQDYEILPPRSLKGRLKDKLLRRSRAPRRL